MADAQRNVIISLKLVGDPKNQATAGVVASQVLSVVTAGNKAYEELRNISGNIQKQITSLQKVQSGLRVNLERKEQSARVALLEDAFVKLTNIEEKRTQAIETEDKKREKKQKAALKKQLKEAEELAKKSRTLSRRGSKASKKPMKRV